MEVTREQLEHYRPLNLNLTLANGEEDILKVTNVVYSGLKLEPHNKSKTLNNLITTIPPSLLVAALSQRPWCSPLTTPLLF